MKRLLLSFMVILMMSMLVVSSNAAVVGTRVVLDTKKIELNIENSAFYQLTATVSTEGGVTLSSTSSSAVTWSSDNEEVAKVDNTGDVVAIWYGKAKITATSVADPTKKDTCVVTVKPAKVSISSRKEILDIGETIQLSAQTNFVIAGMLEDSVDWSSSDESVVKVTNSRYSTCSGIVTAVGSGTARIIASAIMDPTRTAVCTVKVNVPKVTMSSSRESLDIGGTVQLTASSDLTGDGVTWSSDNESVATVSSTGLVTAIASGAARITASSVTNPAKPVKCTVKVNKISITLDKTKTEMEVGDTLKLAETVSPEGDVTWSSNMPSVATVSNDGTVTAIAKGSVTITATSVVDPKRKAKCVIKVIPTSDNNTGEVFVPSVTPSPSPSPTPTITYNFVTSVAVTSNGENGTITTYFGIENMKYKAIERYGDTEVIITGIKEILYGVFPNDRFVVLLMDDGTVKISGTMYKPHKFSEDLGISDVKRISSGATNVNGRTSTYFVFMMNDDRRNLYGYGYNGPSVIQIGTAFYYVNWIDYRRF